MAGSSATDLHIVPLGAGDLIDRAVRLYRRHLLVLIRIAAPPVFVSALGSVIVWTIAGPRVFSTQSGSDLALYILLTLAGLGLLIGGHLFGLIVMGGASRNLVEHLLWNEPVRARATYAAVRSRFWSLLGASLIISMWIGLSFSVAFFGWYLVVLFISVGSILLAQLAPVWMSAIVGAIGVLAGTTVALWLFFFMVGRVAYVPQVMLVEGKRVFESVSRSFTLAKGNVRRLMAMTLFILFATYSALMILIIPLSWFGYLNGIDPAPWSAAQWPVWYAISYSILEPLSSILLAPVWMLGMSLLYVDERVRHEGYDIELMASQKLPPMPQLNVNSPLEPAIFLEPGKGSRPHTQFGCKCVQTLAAWLRLQMIRRGTALVGGPCRSRVCRLLLSVSFLIFVPAIQAIPIAEYHANVRQAVTALDSLAFSDESENTFDYTTRSVETVAGVRKTAAAQTDCGVGRDDFRNRQFVVTYRTRQLQ